MRATFALVFVAAMLFDVGAPPPKKLLPIDEASKDASLVAFRDHLQQAVRERDGDYVLSTVDPDIKLSFGGDHGVAAFKRLWLTPGMKTNDSDLWTELGEVLKLGGVYQASNDTAYFTAPYVFDAWPDAYDPFEYVAVVRETAYLRSAPTEQGAVVTELSYDILHVLNEWVNGSSDWMEVEMLDGTAGYVSAADVRSPIDYRAFFQKRDGEWKMTIFIAGD